MTESAPRPRGLSNLRLKVVGCALIILSCVSGLVLPNGVDGTALSTISMGDLTIAVLCEAVSWAAAPVYAWLLVDGYRHTRRVWAYVARLFALAVVSEVPYDLATSGQVVDWNSQNPVFALAIAAVALALLDTLHTRSAAIRRLVAVAVTVAALVWMVLGHIGLRQQIVPLGVLILVQVLLFRYLAKRENLMMMLAAAAGALCGIMPAFGVVLLHYRNGALGYDRAARPWVQWLFYVLYPAVLLVFGLI